MEEEDNDIQEQDANATKVDGPDAMEQKYGIYLILIGIF
jgi:hypothetical protein